MTVSSLSNRVLSFSDDPGTVTDGRQYREQRLTCSTVTHKCTARRAMLHCLLDIL